MPRTQRLSDYGLWGGQGREIVLIGSLRQEDDKGEEWICIRTKKSRAVLGMEETARE